MKTKEKLLTILIGSLLLTAILFPSTTHAALQANGSGASTKNVDGWMSSIRQMEAQGGTLGLNGSSSLQQQPGEDGKVADSNNLDIHMQKNTEYGAMAILSASSYGKSTPVHKTDDGSLSTTTGNKSGVYISLTKEYTAAGIMSSMSTYKNANLKYRNPYTATGRQRLAGDATLECQGWHNTGTTVASAWFKYDYYGGLLRSYSGSIFSFEYQDCREPFRSRAVVVLGSRSIVNIPTFRFLNLAFRVRIYKNDKRILL